MRMIELEQSPLIDAQARPEQAPQQVLTSTSKKRLVLHPLFGPPEGVDLTDAIITAVASELWKRFGGNDVVNWLEAERLVLRSLQPG